MQVRDGTLLLSPTDLSGYLACPRLTQLEIGVARGERKRPVFDDPYAELIQAKGREHESAYLDRVVSAVPLVVRVDGRDPVAAAKETEAAIREGRADVIYQAHLSDVSWRGVADFLERMPDGTYEPVETKLARATHPEHLLQLCFYAEQLARIQGRLPERVHVEPGSGKRESFRTADYMAYFRRVRGRFLAAIAAGNPAYPWPCDHCSICRWRRECHAKLTEDDSPMLVAGMTRAVADALAKASITTLAGLAGLRRDTDVEGINPARLEAVRHQAALQFEYLGTQKHRISLLPETAGRGFHLLPRPSPGDIWLDFEDHPFFEPARGLECLFGYAFRDDLGGALRYEALWAKDRQAEKEAFERLVDWIVERRRRDPGLHVYHYGDHERSTLRRLMGEHGTRENEIDDFLRSGVFVDLYRVTRQALRASVHSYSLKVIEALYGFQRTAEVEGGAESAALFDKWLITGEPSILESIERYNEEDCRSAAALHEWLLGLRRPDMAWRPPPSPIEDQEEAQEGQTERDDVKRRLLARSEGEGDAPWLLAQLLDYHRREARPQWWEWFHNQELDDDELIESSTTLGGLTRMGDPVLDKKSLVYPFSFPPQDHKIRDKACDPQTGKQYKVRVDEENGRVTVRRGRERADEPLPRGLIPTGPIDDKPQRAALLRLASSYLAGDGRYAALVDVLERKTPRAKLDGSPPEAALSLDASYLIVQGPPGTGKTWQGAKAAVALMRAGRRIGVTSLSHKAIDNLLGEIEREASEQGFAFRGRKKHTNDDTVYSGTFIQSSGENSDLLDPKLLLIAGTMWVFTREEFDAAIDTLFIDEAGQVSLADALAGGTAARNLVFLGDPNQLPQVSQGAQPREAKSSGLRHLLGTHQTVPPTLGQFLAESWRLRPEPCEFTSEAYYEGRLTTAPSSALRSLAAGNGLALLPVNHEGCSQASKEEVAAIQSAIEALLGSTFTQVNGVKRPLEPKDILVVAPYNAQVRALQRRVPDGVRVGTVDKFQGQEAAVVFVSFASSSGADAPRGIQFAFDRHRVNVATSRAQCRVVIVCAPRLLEAECRTIDQMRLMNAVCRFVEMAEPNPEISPAAKKSTESKLQFLLF